MSVRNFQFVKFLGGSLVVTGLGLAIYSLIALAPLFSNRKSEHPIPSIGNFAPDFTLVALTGENVKLSDLRGKPVVINFWATWCGPCVIEMPSLQKFFENYPGEFEILAVNADEPQQKIEQFIGEIGVTFRVLLDPGANVQDQYYIRGYPTTYFVDSQGIISAQHIGMLTEQQIQGYLLALGIGK